MIIEFVRFLLVKITLCVESSISLGMLALKRISISGSVWNNS